MPQWEGHSVSAPTLGTSLSPGALHTAEKMQRGHWGPGSLSLQGWGAASIWGINIKDTHIPHTCVYMLILFKYVHMYVYAHISVASTLPG